MDILELGEPGSPAGLLNRIGCQNRKYELLLKPGKNWIRPGRISDPKIGWTPEEPIWARFGFWLQVGGRHGAVTDAGPAAPGADSGPAVGTLVAYGSEV